MTAICYVYAPLFGNVLKVNNLKEPTDAVDQLLAGQLIS
jgi:hypothetical protein